MDGQKKYSGENRKMIRVMDGSFYAVIILGFIAVLLYGRPVFAINDDLGLYSVLSGAYLGYPDAHVSFMEYPFSWMLASLYKLCKTIPWYGIVLEGILLLCVLLGYQRCSKLLKRTEHGICAAIGLCLIFCMSWFCMLLAAMLRLQYTIVAGVCGATALFLFVTSDDTQSMGCFIKQNIGTVCLGLLAESIRPEMLLMLLGFASVLWIGRLCCRLEVTGQYGVYIKRYLSVLGLFVVGLAAILLSSRVAYGSEEWKSFRQIDRYRVSLFDYYGYPSYDDYEAYFEERGIDRASYEAVANLHMYPGRNLSVEQWKDITELAKEVYQEQHPVSERLSKVLPAWQETLRSDDLKPYNRIVILGYLLCLCLILVCWDKESGILFLCLLAARAVCWCALVFRGRYPDRIVISLFLMEFAVLSAIMLRTLVRSVARVWAKAEKLVGMAVLTILILLLCICHRTWLNRTRQDYNERQKECWDGLKAYCHEREKSLYIWTGGSNTLYYFYDTPFSDGLSDYENYFLMSSGHMMNPNTTQKLEQWGIEDLMDAIVTDGRIYLIFQEGKLDESNTLVTYYQELYDTFYYEQIDTFEAGNVRYEVYRFGI